MNNSVFSRRRFMQASLVVLSTPTIISACGRARQAQQDGLALTTLDAAEAMELEAMAARIIPADNTPGAREAGVIYFMDTVLGDDRAEQLAELRAGLADFQAAVSEQYGASFSELDAARQDAALGEIEQTPFFATVRYLTIAGTFSLPRYGGNRDGIGFDLIGFQEQFAWAPPFGYYDAQYRQRGGR